MLDLSVTVNTYPGGVATVEIPTIEPPSESMSIELLVLLIVLGLIVVTTVALIIMYVVNRKKLKAGGLQAFVFNKNSAKVLDESFDGKNSGVYEPDGKNFPQSEESMRVEEISAPRAVPI